MNFNHIQYIVELAKHKSISSAAKQLHLAQPSLTTIVKKVEHELNIQLFDRTYNGISLTAAGEQALPYLQSLLDTYKAMQQTLHAKNEKFVIGLNASTFYIIQPMLKKMKRLFPSFQLESIDFHEHIIETIKSGQFDLTIITASQFKALDTAKFTYMPFTQSHIVALSSKPFPHDVLTLADLAGEQFVLYKQHDLEQYVRTFTPLMAQASSYISTVNGDLIRQLLVDERFVHITLESALQHFEPALLQQLHTYRIAEMNHTFEYGWLYAKQSPKAARISQLLEHMKS